MKNSQDFLEELAHRLNKSLPKEVAEARLREMRSHVAAAVEEVGEDLALQRFGAPSAVAREIVRQARGFDSKSALSLSLWSGLLLAIGFIFSSLWMDRAMTWISLLAAAWVPFFGVLFFAVRCYQTRRWLVLPVAGWGAIGIGLYFVLSTIFPARLEASTRSSQIKGALEAVAIWDQNAKGVQAWRQGHPPTDTAPYAWHSPTSMYIVGLPFAVPISSPPIYDIEHFIPGQRDGIGSWRLYGEAWAKTVADRQKSAAEYLASLQKGLARPPTPVSDKLYFWKLAVAQLAAVLFTFNALALLLGRISEQWPRRYRTRRA